MIPSTFLYLKNFVTNHEDLFDELKSCVNWREDILSRKTASFGIPYNYSTTTYLYSEIPQFLQAILDSVNKEVGYVSNNILINYYDQANSKMGFHSDQTQLLEENTGVVIVSLGNKRIMRIKSKLDKNKISDYELEPGSLFFMSKYCQELFLHSIIPSVGISFERISLTFRRLIN